MRKLILQIQTTMDGFICGPKGEMDWMQLAWSPDLVAITQALTDSMDTIVLGRKLAEGFIPHWAAVAADTNNPEHEAGKIFSGCSKVVFTRSLSISPWENTILAKGDLIDEINSLKNKPGKNIIAYGGGTFVSDLIKHQLIDELNLFINPATIGNGMPIFKAVERTTKYNLVAVKPTTCGIIVTTYKPL